MPQRQALPATTGLAARQQQFKSLLSGSGQPVTVTYASGEKRRLNLSVDAIRSYQKAGLKVSPISFTYDYRAGTKFPTPAIPRIVDKTDRWSLNPTPIMTVPSQPRRLAPKPKRLSAFGGLGANPWNPIEGIAGLFGMTQQEQPADRYLPSEAADITPRPTYQAFASQQEQRGSMLYSNQGFNQLLTQQKEKFNPKDELSKLTSNPWVLYIGLGIAALIILKITMGFLSGGRASQGAPSGGFIIRT